MDQFYNSKDREVLISLLMEYSHRMLRICDEIEERRYDFSKRILTLILLAFAGSFAFYFSYLAIINPNIRRLLMVAVSSAAFCAVGYYMDHFYQIDQKLKLLRRDAKTFSIRLEKVVRFASQMREHSVTNAVSRIELDLRIADAESALAHYQSVQNNGIRNKFSVKLPV